MLENYFLLFYHNSNYNEINEKKFRNILIIFLYSDMIFIKRGRIDKK